MAKYKVKAGRRFGAGGMYGPGEIVELDPLEAKSFMDKLDLVESPTMDPPAELKNELKVEIPEDSKLLKSKPAAEDEFSIKLESDPPAPETKKSRTKKAG